MGSNTSESVRRAIACTPSIREGGGQRHDRLMHRDRQRGAPLAPSRRMRRRFSLGHRLAFYQGVVQDGNPQEADMAGLVLVVAGRVRRGQLSAAGGVCDSCRGVATMVLTSKRGLVTLLCDACRVVCDEPQPQTVDEVVCASVDVVRSAAAEGRLRHSQEAFGAAERYEKEHAKWVKLTTPHGYWHPEPRRKNGTGIGNWVW